MHAIVRWVLFDAVGTLIYADPPASQVYHAAGQRFGSSATAVEIEQRFAQALAAEIGPETDLQRPPTSEAGEVARWRRIVAAVFLDVSPETADDLFQSLWDHFAQPRHWRVFPDVERSLATLQKSGLQLGIASNFDGRLLNIARELPELAPCSRIFVSSQLGFSKPDPRFCRAIAADLAAAPAEILLVGDDWTADIQGAAAAGWPAIWICRGGAAAGRERAIASLGELATFALASRR
jgi:putative hydrolase of the HAD superfamily